jgi:hypothetical protein
VSITRPTATVEIDFTTNLSAGFAYSERVLSDGPYRYYQLRETSGTSAADASGNGLTGTYSGTITYDQTSGKPVTGETASRYIDIASVGRVAFAQPPAGTTRLTLEAWVYRATLDGNAATRYMIADADGDSDGNDWMGWSVRGDGSIHMKSGNCDWTSTTTPITAAAWHHLAVVMDVEADTVTFYRNGAALAATFSPAIDAGKVGFQRTGAVSWYWGKAIDNTTNSTVSRIAEPAVYTEALAASQVNDHYTAATVTPFAGYTWTNVTPYLDDTDPITRRFGRESSLSEVTPMELSFRLRNRDRRFEIENSASPYYPNVEGGRPCRVTMVQDAITYNWAFGFIQDFPQDYPEGALVGSVPIVATCYLERIQQSDMGTRAFTQQLAGARINRVLHIAGQPTSMRTLDAGANTMMAQTDASGTVGDHAQKVARSDRGLFFFDGQGYAVFQDGTYRATNSRAISAQGTLGLPEIGYRRPNFHAPLSMVRNIIKLRRPGGVEVTAVDAVSKGKRGERDYSDELLLVDDSTLASRAADLLADYKDPVLRIRSVEFSPQQADGFWADSLGVRLSDRYMWTFAPMVGSPVLRDVHVEGVADVYDFREGAYSSVWFLSLAAPAPAPAAGSFRGLLALTG